MGVSEKTISRYEKTDLEPRYPEVYEKLGELFQLPGDYFRGGNVLPVAAARLTRVPADMRATVNEVVGLFAGGELSAEDKKAVLETIQEAYYIAKLRKDAQRDEKE